MVENYPWVIWEDGNELAEEYYIRLILETTLWGIAALLLEVGSNIAGISLSADPEFPNSPENKKDIYKV